MASEWVVILEMVQPQGLGRLAYDRMNELLGAVADARPAALLGPDRCALQLQVVADGPAEALLVGLARWRDAAGRLCAPESELARAEVLTPAELDRECDVLHARSAGAEERARPLMVFDEEEALLHVAFEDPLTGLPAQAMFHDTLERALAQGSLAGRHHSLLLVDLDGFRAINTRLGRRSGDGVLTAVAGRLVGAVRETDVVARLSGDQFGVLLRNTTTAVAAAIGERIVQQLRAAVPLGEVEILPRATVGIAVATSGRTATELLQEAGAALLIGKRRGGDRAVVFSAPALVPAVAEMSFDPVAVEPDAAAYVELLSEVARLANMPHSFEEAATAVVGEVLTHTGLSRGHLWLRTEAGLWRVVSLRPYEIVDGAVDARVVRRATAVGSVIWEVSEEGDTGRTVAVAVPVLVGQQPVAVLSFVADEPMVGRGMLVRALGAVGIQLGRVAERNRAGPLTA